MGHELGNMNFAHPIDVTVLAKVSLDGCDMAKIADPGSGLQEGEMLAAIFIA